MSHRTRPAFRLAAAFALLATVACSGQSLEPGIPPASTTDFGFFGMGILCGRIDLDLD